MHCRHPPRRQKAAAEARRRRQSFVSPFKRGARTWPKRALPLPEGSQTGAPAVAAAAAAERGVATGAAATEATTHTAGRRAAVSGPLPTAGAVAALTLATASRGIVTLSAESAATWWSSPGPPHPPRRSVIPRLRMGTLHPFSNRMYPLGPQVLGTWTSV